MCRGFYTHVELFKGSLLCRLSKPPASSLYLQDCLSLAQNEQIGCSPGHRVFFLLVDNLLSGFRLNEARRGRTDLHESQAWRARLTGRESIQGDSKRCWWSPRMVVKDVAKYLMIRGPGPSISCRGRPGAALYLHVIPPWTEHMSVRCWSLRGAVQPLV